MGRDVERRKTREQEEDTATKPPDPSAGAYAAGMELARRLGSGGGPPPGKRVAKKGKGGEVKPTDDDLDEGSFDSPFFKQGQTRRERITKKTKHVISEDEYILSEETTEAEMFSFGDDIFKDK